MYDRRTPEERQRDAQQELEFIEMMQAQADKKTEALKAELERLKAEAEATGGKKNVRGSVTAALMPRISILREATLLGTPITKQQAMLERSGIIVSYNSLRKFIQKHLAREYRTFLANVRTTGEMGEMSEQEQESVERFVQQDQQLPTGAGNQKEEAATETKPAATGDKKPPMRTSGQLRAEADRYNLNDYSD
ncbi:TPA: hypothetical protein L5C15_005775 [Pseudomonas aeruginosa]|uniref:hypothetical protein n=1 Tax=Pseudomonas aeruginosa TaxID=287 RepID=UPI000940E248|nr:hypothetical protein [Pseudomonas aeruginosa]OKS33362.1 hypothetical protein BH608_18050 [Pseudomonas aeruginosa]HBO7934638.1 hypothetical protein [Pseudomonas aeruginosa]HBO8188580.1 hypothetical protein [Pseudomonas aeruginosa]HBO8713829.1 hypothetical protein [Pseudomonas aeruginosa]